MRSEYKIPSSHVKIIKLYKNLRRVAILHACTEDYTFNRRKLRVRHELAAIDGGDYKLYMVLDGNPPHSGWRWIISSR